MTTTPQKCRLIVSEIITLSYRMLPIERLFVSIRSSIRAKQARKKRFATPPHTLSSDAGQGSKTKSKRCTTAKMLPEDLLPVVHVVDPEISIMEPLERLPSYEEVKKLPVLPPYKSHRKRRRHRNARSRTVNENPYDGNFHVWVF